MLEQIGKEWGLFPTPGPEKPDPIGNLYGDLLGRSPDKEGYDYWNKQLQSGSQTLDQIADNIMRSDEYQKKRGGPGRGQTPKPMPPIVRPTPRPEPPIGRPAPRPTPRPPAPTPRPPAPTPRPKPPIVRPLPQPSPRPIPTPRPTPPDSIGDLYKNLLGRKADAGGRDYWTKQLQSGSQTLDQIKANIMRSDEYQKKNR
jgi:hypothetical protein